MKSVENPLFIVVKAKDSNCAPAVNILLAIHQTDSQEKHYSKGKRETGICGYNMGNILRWLEEYMHGVFYQNENQ